MSAFPLDVVVFPASSAGPNWWLVLELGHDNRQKALDVRRVRREFLLIGRSVDGVRSLDIGGWVACI